MCCFHFCVLEGGGFWFNFDAFVVCSRHLGEWVIMGMEWTSLFLREQLHILARMMFILEKWQWGKPWHSQQGAKELEHVMVSHLPFLFNQTMPTFTIPIYSCLMCGFSSLFVMIKTCYLSWPEEKKKQRSSLTRILMSTWR